MKRTLMLGLISLATALPAVTALAAANPAGRHGVEPIQVKAQLYRAWLSGTTAADEKIPIRMRLRTDPQYRHRVVVMCLTILVHRNFQRSHDRFAPNNGALLSVFDYWRANLSQVSSVVIRYIR